jgi:hypothetical protein
MVPEALGKDSLLRPALSSEKASQLILEGDATVSLSSPYIGSRVALPADHLPGPPTRQLHQVVLLSTAASQR